VIIVLYSVIQKTSSGDITNKVFVVEIGLNMSIVAKKLINIQIVSDTI